MPWRRLVPGTHARAPSLIVTDDGIARSLGVVIAILTFLAALAAGAADMVVEASAGWRASLAREATIQLRPRAGRDIEADLARAAEIARAAPGIAAVRPLTKAAGEELLEPWLGRGLDLGMLPVPRLVGVTLTEAGQAALPGLRAQIAAEIPGASLDDHGPWLSRLSTLADGLTAVAVALVALVLAAAGLAVAFATRGVIARSRDVIEVLHLIGADERFVMRAFASHFLRLGLLSAVSGAAAAALSFGLAAFLTVPGGPDPTAGAVSLGPRGYGLIVATVAAVAGIAAASSGLTVKRFLRQAGAG